MILTFNKLVKHLENWRESKSVMIKDFGYGVISDFGNSRQLNYPAMWVDNSVAPSNIVITNRSQVPEVPLSIMFIDRISQQTNVDNENGYLSDNRADIMSDTFQMGQDLVADLVASFQTIGVFIKEGTNVTATPVEDETPDKVCGWLFEIPITLPRIACVSTGFTPSSLPAIIKNTDDTFSLSVFEGTTTVLNDIEIEIGGGTITRPSAKDLDLSFYYPLTFKTGMMFPANPPVSGLNQLPWLNTVNATTSSGVIEATSDNANSNVFLATNGGFEISCNTTLSSSTECGIGLKFNEGGVTKNSCSFVLLANGEVYVNSELVHTDSPAGITDLKVVVDGVFVNFFINDTQIYTAYNISNDASGRGYMIFTPILRFAGDILENIRINFG